MSIHYKDGRKFNIHYIRVKAPVEFEKPYPKGQSPKGWRCPRGGCCTS